MFVGSFCRFCSWKEQMELEEERSRTGNGREPLLSTSTLLGISGFCFRVNECLDGEARAIELVRVVLLL